MASQGIWLPLLLLAFATVCRAHELLPTVLLDKASPLSDISAKEILKEVNIGSNISKQLCEEAGFLCGTTKPATKPSDDSNLLFYPPATKLDYPTAMKLDSNLLFYPPATKPSDDSNLLFYPPATKPSADTNFLFYPPATKPSDDTNLLFYPSATKPSDDSNFLFYPPATKPATKPSGDTNFLFYPPATKPATKPSDDSNLLFYPPATKPATKPSDDSNLLFYPPATKPATKPSEDTNFLFYPPATKPSSDDTNFLFYPPTTKPSSDDTNFLFYPPATKPSRHSKLEKVSPAHRMRMPAHHMHGHGNEDKAAVLFFRMATASKGHKMVLPPLADSSRLQASKFLHPSLEKVFEGMTVPRLLTAMSIPSQSALAQKTMEKDSLCTGEGPAGEVKKCVASAHAMLEFAASVLKASQHELKYMLNTRTQTAFEVFEVVDRVTVDQRFVTCHSMLFPYAVYMCHNIPKTVVLKITLRDGKGDKVTVPGICHMDTSSFEPSHIGFQVLQTRPGVGEMCHWMPNSHIVWYTEAAA